MGRKTWDSIPPKFRPLKDRLNIVISRSSTAPATSPPNVQEPVRVSSIESALQYAREHCAGRVFVMGGGQIYDAALKLPEARRVLLTSLDADYDCDCFFGANLREDGETAPGWARSSNAAWKDWTGEQDVEDGKREEAGVKYEFQMWERE